MNESLLNSIKIIFRGENPETNYPKEEYIPKDDSLEERLKQKMSEITIRNKNCLTCAGCKKPFKNGEICVDCKDWRFKYPTMG